MRKLDRPEELVLADGSVVRLGRENEVVWDLAGDRPVVYRQVRAEGGRRLAVPRTFVAGGDSGWAETGDPVSPVVHEAWLAGANRGFEAARSLWDIAARSGSGVPQHERLTAISAGKLKELLRGSRDDAVAAIVEAARRKDGVTLRWTQLSASHAFDAGHDVNMAAGEGKSWLFLMDSARRAVRDDVDAVQAITTRENLADREFEHYVDVLRWLGITVHRTNSDSLPPEPVPGQPTIYVTTLEDVGFTYLKHGLVPGQRKNGSTNIDVNIDEVDEAIVYANPLFVISDGALGDAPSEVVEAVRAAGRFLRGQLAGGGLSGADFGRVPGREGEPSRLTEAGAEKAAGLLGRELTDGERHRLDMAADAHWDLGENIHYMIDEGMVLILDQTTHKVMRGLEKSTETENSTASRWNGGRAQAVEEKHGLPIRDDADTSKSVTAKQLFALDVYGRVVGASGTALGKSEHFAALGSSREGQERTIVDIPRYYESRLEVEPDHVSPDLETKLDTLADGIEAELAAGGGQARPQWVVTHRNDLVEKLSQRLTDRGVPHMAVDARWQLDQGAHLEEAFNAVLAKAGALGQVLIGNMQLGRGVDITVTDAANTQGGPLLRPTARSAISSDIDKQVENRVARSGNPGSVRYHISPDDDLFRLSRNDKVQLAIIRYEQALTNPTEHTAAIKPEHQEQLHTAEEALRDLVGPVQHDSAARLGIHTPAVPSADSGAENSGVGPGSQSDVFGVGSGVRFPAAAVPGVDFDEFDDVPPGRVSAGPVYRYDSLVPEQVFDAGFLPPSTTAGVPSPAGVAVFTTVDRDLPALPEEAGRFQYEVHAPGGIVTAPAVGSEGANAAGVVFPGGVGARFVRGAYEISGGDRVRFIPNPGFAPHPVIPVATVRFDEGGVPFASDVSAVTDIAARVASIALWRQGQGLPLPAITVTGYSEDASAGSVEAGRTDRPHIAGASRVFTDAIDAALGRLAGTHPPVTAKDMPVTSIFTGQSPPDLATTPSTPVSRVVTVSVDANPVRGPTVTFADRRPAAAAVLPEWRGLVDVAKARLAVLRERDEAAYVGVMRQGFAVAGASDAVRPGRTTAVWRGLYDDFAEVVAAELLDSWDHATGDPAPQSLDDAREFARGWRERLGIPGSTGGLPGGAPRSDNKPHTAGESSRSAADPLADRELRGTGPPQNAAEGSSRPASFEDGLAAAPGLREFLQPNAAPERSIMADVDLGATGNIGPGLSGEPGGRPDPEAGDPALAAEETTVAPHPRGIDEVRPWLREHAALARQSFTKLTKARETELSAQAAQIVDRYHHSTAVGQPVMDDVTAMVAHRLLRGENAGADALAKSLARSLGTGPDMAFPSDVPSVATSHSTEPPPLPARTMRKPALRVPGYLLRSKGLGPAVQFRRTEGADKIVAAIRELVPGEADKQDLATVQHEVENEFGSFLTEGRVLRLNGERLLVQAELEFAERSETPESGKAKAAHRDTGHDSGAGTSSGRKPMTRWAYFTPMVPGLFSMGVVNVPTAPAFVREHSHRSGWGSRTSVSLPEHVTEGTNGYQGMTAMRVPAKLRIVRLDSAGEPTGPTVILGSRGRDADRVVVPLSVPTGLLSDGSVVPMPRSLPNAVVEGAAVRTTTPGRYQGRVIRLRPGRSRGIFEQLSAHLGKLGKDSQETLREFVSSRNITDRLPEMAVSPRQAEAGQGWVTSAALHRGGNPIRRLLSRQVSKLQMRAVARQVAYVQTIDDAQFREHSEESSTVSAVNTSGREISTTIAGGPGIDVGVVTAGAGPFVGAGIGRSRAQEHNRGTKTADERTYTAPVVRYRTVYELQFRTPGRSPVTFADAVDAYHWAKVEDAERAGLSGDRGQGPVDFGGAGAHGTAEPVTTDRIRQAAAGAALQLEEASGLLNDMLRDSTKTLPGHHRWAWRDAGFVAGFDDPKLARGLSAKDERELGRAEEIRGGISAENLARRAPEMLEGRPLILDLTPEPGRGHDYHVGFRIKADLDGDLVDLGPVPGAGSTKTTESESSGKRSVRDWSLGGGILGRVYAALAGTAVFTNYHKLFYAGSKSTVRERTAELGVGGAHGGQLDEAGGVRPEPLHRYAAKVRLAVSGTHWSQPNDLVRGLTVGSRGRHAPETHELEIVDEAAARQGRTPGTVTVDVVLELPASHVDPRKTVEPVNRTELPDVSLNRGQELRQGGLRQLDGMPIISLRGLEHVREAVRSTLERASDDPIWRFEDGDNSGLIDAAVSVGALRTDPRAFSRPTAVSGLRWNRRRADEEAVAAVSYALRDPRVVTTVWQQPDGSITGGTATGKETAGTWKVTNTGEVAFIGKSAEAAHSPGTVTQAMGLLLQEIALWVSSFGKKSGQRTSVSTSRALKGEPRRLHLVDATVEATVAAETLRRGNLDRWSLRRPKPVGRAAERFELPDAARVLVTDGQLHEIRVKQAEQDALRAETADGPPVLPALPAFEDRADGWDTGTDAPEGHDLGLSNWADGIAEPIDLTHLIPRLHEQLERHFARELTDSHPAMPKQLIQDRARERAERLLPSSSLETEHDNPDEVRRYLSNLQTSLGDVANGGTGTSLRLEDRLNGRTYELRVDAQPMGRPRPGRVTHGELVKATAAVVTTSKSRSLKRVLVEGLTLLTSAVSFRSESAVKDVEANPGTHGAPYSNHGFAPAVVFEWLSQFRETKRQTTTEHVHTETVRGALAEHHVKALFDVRIERHGERIAAAPETLTLRTHSPIEDGGTSHADRARGLAEERPRTEATEENIARWRAADGAEPLPDDPAQYRVIDFEGETSDLLKAAERALAHAGVRNLDVTTRGMLSDAVAPSRLKALAGPHTRDGQELELPPELGVRMTLHAMVPGSGELTGASARIELGGSTSSSRSEHVETGSGGGYEVDAAPYFGPGVPHPPEAGSGGGQQPFGALADWVMPLEPRGARMAEHEHATGAESGGAALPAAGSTDHSPITSTWAHGTRFRLVVEPASTITAKRGAVVDVDFERGYVIRHTGRADRLPESLVQRTKELAERDAEWEIARGRLRAAYDGEPDSELLPAAAKSSTFQVAREAERAAANAWTQAKSAYEAELAVARQDPELGGGRPSASVVVHEGQGRLPVEQRARLFSVAKDLLQAHEAGALPRVRYRVLGDVRGAPARQFSAVAREFATLLELAQSAVPRHERLGPVDLGLDVAPRFVRSPGPTTVEVWIDYREPAVPDSPDNEPEKLASASTTTLAGEGEAVADKPQPSVDPVQEQTSGRTTVVPESPRDEGDFVIDLSDHSAPLDAPVTERTQRIRDLLRHNVVIADRIDGTAIRRDAREALAEARVEQARIDPLLDGLADSALKDDFKLLPHEGLILRDGQGGEAVELVVRALPGDDTSDTADNQVRPGEKDYAHRSGQVASGGFGKSSVDESAAPHREGGFQQMTSLPLGTSQAARTLDVSAGFRGFTAHPSWKSGATRELETNVRYTPPNDWGDSRHDLRHHVVVRRVAEAEVHRTGNQPGGAQLSAPEVLADVHPGGEVPHDGPRGTFVRGGWRLFDEFKAVVDQHPAWRGEADVINSPLRGALLEASRSDGLSRLGNDLVDGRTLTTKLEIHNLAGYRRTALLELRAEATGGHDFLSARPPAPEPAPGSKDTTLVEQGRGYKNSQSVTSETRQPFDIRAGLGVGFAWSLRDKPDVTPAEPSFGFGDRLDFRLDGIGFGFNNNERTVKQTEEVTATTMKSASGRLHGHVRDLSYEITVRFDDNREATGTLDEPEGATTWTMAREPTTAGPEPDPGTAPFSPSKILGAAETRFPAAERLLAGLRAKLPDGVLTAGDGTFTSNVKAADNEVALRYYMSDRGLTSHAAGLNAEGMSFLLVRDTYPVTQRPDDLVRVVVQAVPRTGPREQRDQPGGVAAVPHDVELEGKLEATGKIEHSDTSRVAGRAGASSSVRPGLGAGEIARTAEFTGGFNRSFSDREHKLESSSNRSRGQGWRTDGVSEYRLEIDYRVTLSGRGLSETFVVEGGEAVTARAGVTRLTEPPTDGNTEYEPVAHPVPERPGDWSPGELPDHFAVHGLDLPPGAARVVTDELFGGFRDDAQLAEQRVHDSLNPDEVAVRLDEVVTGTYWHQAHRYGRGEGDFVGFENHVGDYGLALALSNPRVSGPPTNVKLPFAGKASGKIAHSVRQGSTGYVYADGRTAVVPLAETYLTPQGGYGFGWKESRSEATSQEYETAVYATYDGPAYLVTYDVTSLLSGRDVTHTGAGPYDGATIGAQTRYQANRRAGLQIWVPVQDIDQVGLPVGWDWDQAGLPMGWDGALGMAGTDLASTPQVRVAPRQVYDGLVSTKLRPQVTAAVLASLKEALGLVPRDVVPRSVLGRFADQLTGLAQRVVFGSAERLAAERLVQQVGGDISPRGLETSLPILGAAGKEWTATVSGPFGDITYTPRLKARLAPGEFLDTQAGWLDSFASKSSRVEETVHEQGRFHNALPAVRMPVYLPDQVARALGWSAMTVPSVGTVGKRTEGTETELNRSAFVSGDMVRYSHDLELWWEVSKTANPVRALRGITGGLADRVVPGPKVDRSPLISVPEAARTRVPLGESARGEHRPGPLTGLPSVKYATVGGTRVAGVVRDVMDGVAPGEHVGPSPQPVPAEATAARQAINTGSSPGALSAHLPSAMSATGYRLEGLDQDSFYTVGHRHGTPLRALTFRVNEIRDANVLPSGFTPKPGLDITSTDVTKSSGKTEHTAGPMWTTAIGTVPVTIFPDGGPTGGGAVRNMVPGSVTVNIGEGRVMGPTLNWQRTDSVDVAGKTEEEIRHSTGQLYFVRATADWTVTPEYASGADPAWNTPRSARDVVYFRTDEDGLRQIGLHPPESGAEGGPLVAGINRERYETGIPEDPANCAADVIATYKTEVLGETFVAEPRDGPVRTEALEQSLHATFRPVSGGARQIEELLGTERDAHGVVLVPSGRPRVGHAANVFRSRETGELEFVHKGGEVFPREWLDGPAWFLRIQTPAEQVFLAEEAASGQGSGRSDEAPEMVGWLPGRARQSTSDSLVGRRRGGGGTPMQRLVDRLLRRREPAHLEPAPVPLVDTPPVEQSAAVSEVDSADAPESVVEDPVSRWPVSQELDRFDYAETLGTTESRVLDLDTLRPDTTPDELVRLAEEWGEPDPGRLVEVTLLTGEAPSALSRTAEELGMTPRALFRLGIAVGVPPRSLAVLGDHLPSGTGSVSDPEMVRQLREGLRPFGVRTTGDVALLAGLANRSWWQPGDLALLEDFAGRRMVSLELLHSLPDGFVAAVFDRLRAAELHASDLDELAGVVGLGDGRGGVVAEVAATLGVRRPADLVALADDFARLAPYVDDVARFASVRDYAQKIVGSLRLNLSSRGIDPDRYVAASTRLGFRVVELAALAPSPHFARVLDVFAHEVPSARTDDQLSFYAQEIRRLRMAPPEPPRGTERRLARRRAWRRNMRPELRGLSELGTTLPRTPFRRGHQAFRSLLGLEWEPGEPPPSVDSAEYREQADREAVAGNGLPVYGEETWLDGPPNLSIRDHLRDSRYSDAEKTHWCQVFALDGHRFDELAGQPWFDPKRLAMIADETGLAAADLLLLSQAIGRVPVEFPWRALQLGMSPQVLLTVADGLGGVDPAHLSWLSGAFARLGAEIAEHYEHFSSHFTDHHAVFRVADDDREHRTDTDWFFWMFSRAEPEQPAGEADWWLASWWADRVGLDRRTVLADLRQRPWLDYGRLFDMLEKVGLPSDPAGFKELRAFSRSLERFPDFQDLAERSGVDDPARFYALAQKMKADPYGLLAFPELLKSLNGLNEDQVRNLRLEDLPAWQEADTLVGHLAGALGWKGKARTSVYRLLAALSPSPAELAPENRDAFLAEATRWGSTRGLPTDYFRLVDPELAVLRGKSWFDQKSLAETVRLVGIDHVAPLLKLSDRLGQIPDTEKLKRAAERIGTSPAQLVTDALESGAEPRELEAFAASRRSAKPIVDVAAAYRGWAAEQRARFGLEDDDALAGVSLATVFDVLQEQQRTFASLDDLPGAEADAEIKRVRRTLVEHKLLSEVGLMRTAENRDRLRRLETDARRPFNDVPGLARDLGIAPGTFFQTAEAWRAHPRALLPFTDLLDALARLNPGTPAANADHHRVVRERAFDLVQRLAVRGSPDALSQFLADADSQAASLDFWRAHPDELVQLDHLVDALVRLGPGDRLPNADRYSSVPEEQIYRLVPRLAAEMATSARTLRESRNDPARQDPPRDLWRDHPDARRRFTELLDTLSGATQLHDNARRVAGRAYNLMSRLAAGMGWPEGTFLRFLADRGEGSSQAQLRAADRFLRAWWGHEEPIGRNRLVADAMRWGADQGVRLDYVYAGGSRFAALRGQSWIDPDELANVVEAVGRDRLSEILQLTESIGQVPRGLGSGDRLPTVTSRALLGMASALKVDPAEVAAFVGNSPDQNVRDGGADAIKAGYPRWADEQRSLLGLRPDESLASVQAFLQRTGRTFASLRSLNEQEPGAAARAINAIRPQLAFEARSRWGGRSPLLRPADPQLSAVSRSPAVPVRDTGNVAAGASTHRLSAPAPGQVAGSSRTGAFSEEYPELIGLNPSGNRWNCPDAVVATYNRLRFGGMAIAEPRAGPVWTALLEQTFGGRFEPVGGYDDIVIRLGTGQGAQGAVITTTGRPGVGHAFNVHRKPDTGGTRDPADDGVRLPDGQRAEIVLRERLDQGRVWFMPLPELSGPVSLVSEVVETVDDPRPAGDRPPMLIGGPKRRTTEFRLGRPKRAHYEYPEPPGPVPEPPALSEAQRQQIVDFAGRHRDLVTVLGGLAGSVVPVLEGLGLRVQSRPADGRPHGADVYKGRGPMRSTLGGRQVVEGRLALSLDFEPDLRLDYPPDLRLELSSSGSLGEEQLPLVNGFAAKYHEARALGNLFDSVPPPVWVAGPEAAPIVDLLKDWYGIDSAVTGEGGPPRGGDIHVGWNPRRHLPSLELKLTTTRLTPADKEELDGFVDRYRAVNEARQVQGPPIEVAGGWRHRVLHYLKEVHGISAVGRVGRSGAADLRSDWNTEQAPTTSRMLFDFPPGSTGLSTEQRAQVEALARGLNLVMAKRRALGHHPPIVVGSGERASWVEAEFAASYDADLVATQPGGRQNAADFVIDWAPPHEGPQVISLAHGAAALTGEQLTTVLGIASRVDDVTRTRARLEPLEPGMTVQVTGPDPAVVNTVAEIFRGRGIEPTLGSEGVVGEIHIHLDWEPKTDVPLRPDQLTQLEALVEKYRSVKQFHEYNKKPAPVLVFSGVRAEPIADALRRRGILVTTTPDGPSTGAHGYLAGIFPSPAHPEKSPAENTASSGADEPALDPVPIPPRAAESPSAPDLGTPGPVLPAEADALADLDMSGLDEPMPDLSMYESVPLPDFGFEPLPDLGVPGEFGVDEPMLDLSMYESVPLSDFGFEPLPDLGVPGEFGADDQAWDPAVWDSLAARAGDELGVVGGPSAAEWFDSAAEAERISRLRDELAGNQTQGTGQPSVAPQSAAPQRRVPPSKPKLEDLLPKQVLDVVLAWRPQPGAGPQTVKAFLETDERVRGVVSLEVDDEGLATSAVLRELAKRWVQGLVGCLNLLTGTAYTAVTAHDQLGGLIRVATRDRGWAAGVRELRRLPPDVMEEILRWRPQPGAGPQTVRAFLEGDERVRGVVSLEVDGEGKPLSPVLRDLLRLWLRKLAGERDPLADATYTAREAARQSGYNYKTDTVQVMWRFDEAAKHRAQDEVPEGLSPEFVAMVVAFRPRADGTGPQTIEAFWNELADMGRWPDTVELVTSTKALRGSPQLLYLLRRWAQGLRMQPNPLAGGIAYSVEAVAEQCDFYSASTVRNLWTVDRTGDPAPEEALAALPPEVLDYLLAWRPKTDGETYKEFIRQQVRQGLLPDVFSVVVDSKNRLVSAVTRELIRRWAIGLRGEKNPLKRGERYVTKAAAAQAGVGHSSVEDWWRRAGRDER